MTLTEAVRSLGLVELITVSWINVLSIKMQHQAVFTMALLLPLLDPTLPDEFRTGELRFLPDQRRLLDSPVPMRDQIEELQVARLLGNIISIYLKPIDGTAAGLWIIETHAGSPKERLAWLASVIIMEGRTPIP